LTIVVVVAGRFIYRKLTAGASDEKHWWLQHILPVVMAALLSVVAAVMVGELPGVGVSHYAFASGSAVTDGRYIELARNGESVAIYPCEPTLAGAIVVPVAEMRSTQYDSKSLPRGQQVGGTFSLTTSRSTSACPPTAMLELVDAMRKLFSLGGYCV
jgi:hypothetical protein